MINSEATLRMSSLCVTSHEGAALLNVNHVQDQLFSFLSIALKAGELNLGFSQAVYSLAKCQAKLILITSDLSPKTLGKLTVHARECKICLIHLNTTMQTTERFLGKKSGIITIIGEGFAEKIKKILNNL